MEVIEQKEWICKLNVYFNYVFSAVSSWLLVMLSVERAAFFSVKKTRVCSVLRKKSLVACIILFSLLIYSFSLVTTSVEISETQQVLCTPIKKWLNLVKMMALFDSIIAILLPFVLILISNTIVGFKLIDHSKRFSQSFKINIYDERKPVRRVKKIPAITKILFTISSTFLILNLPIALSKIWHFYKNYDHENHLSPRVKDSLKYHESTDDESSQSLNEEIVERVSCYLYYLNFSINFFLYTLNECKFSIRFLNLFKNRPTNNHSENPLKRENSTKDNTIKVTML